MLGNFCFQNCVDVLSYFIGVQKIGGKIWHFFANFSINNIKYQNNKSNFCKQTFFENEHRDLQI